MGDVSKAFAVVNNAKGIIETITFTGISNEIGRHTNVSIRVWKMFLSK